MTSAERVFCPRHNRQALLIVKTIAGKQYAYARHRYQGRLLDCYLGKWPLKHLDVSAEKVLGKSKVKSKEVV